jgi:hypothetical protein
MSWRVGSIVTVKLGSPADVSTRRVPLGTCTRAPDVPNSAPGLKVKRSNPLPLMTCQFRQRDISAQRVSLGG